jgi:hypothetical protein
MVETREEVATVIQEFLEGSGGEWAWDDFLSFPIDDTELDRIRIRCAHLSGEFAATEGYCGPEGFDVLRAYVRQLRAYS